MSNNKYATINKWYTTIRTDNPYLAPERRGTSFCGLVSGHRELRDGDTITTSAIVSWSSKLIFINGENKLVPVFMTTSGTEYILGNVDSDYENAFPGALKRILEIVREVKEQ